MAVLHLAARHEVGRRDLESLRDNLGPHLCSRLDDPLVTDIMLNQDGTLHEDRLGAGMTMIGRMDEHDALAVINLVAATAGEIVNRHNPVFEGTLPIRTARFIAFVPPLVLKPSFSIRLPATRIYTIEDYIAAGIMTQEQAEVIETAIEREWNILVSGGTKSGKTSLINAIMQRLSIIYPRKRACIIEEIVELQCLQPNTLALRTGPNVDHQDLLKRLMRARPDVIVFGEVRDKAALQLVKAANTGHGSIISTIHANTPRRAPQRMEDLCAEALPGVNLRPQIADALGIIVGITRIDPVDLKEGEPERRITEIVKVEGIQNGEYAFTQLA
jgi:P-type conjugative transfer ATPase TrbB